MSKVNRLFRPLTEKRDKVGTFKREFRWIFPSKHRCLDFNESMCSVLSLRLFSIHLTRHLSAFLLSVEWQIISHTRLISTRTEVYF